MPGWVVESAIVMIATWCLFDICRYTLAAALGYLRFRRAQRIHRQIQVQAKSVAEKVLKRMAAAEAKEK